MKQPIKGGGKIKRKKITKPKSNPFKRRKNSSDVEQKYGTSKLERDFARNFLDKYNINYIYQFEAKEIGRYFDFAVTVYDDKSYMTEEKDGIKCLKQEGQYVPISFFIEVDGDYYHSNPRVVNENKLNPMQKHNKFVDNIKDKWAQMHCIPLLRIWEYDIRNNPEVVVEQLSMYINIGERKRRIDENKRKPH